MEKEKWSKFASWGFKYIFWLDFVSVLMHKRIIISYALIGRQIKWAGKHLSVIKDISK